MSTHTHTDDSSTEFHTAAAKVEAEFEDEENVRVTTHAATARISVKVEKPDAGCTLVPAFSAPDDYEIEDASMHARDIMMVTFRPEEA